MISAVRKAAKSDGMNQGLRQFVHVKLANDDSNDQISATQSGLVSRSEVLRCQRMTLRVKHYDNSGGACTNRDGKGKEEILGERCVDMGIDGIGNISRNIPLNQPLSWDFPM